MLKYAGQSNAVGISGANTVVKHGGRSSLHTKPPMQQQSANAESVEDGEKSTDGRVGREMARQSPRRETGRKPRKWQSLIHPVCECVCVFVHQCYVFIRVHARICNCGLYIYFPRSLPRARREGGGGGTGPADNDVSPARNATLKGAAQDADPKSEDEFELVII